jgi:hypothetical protein
MRSRSRLSRALPLAATLAACATTSAPPHFLPEPEVAGREVHGGWLEVTVANPAGGELRLDGELLAITADSVWLTSRPDSLAAANSGYVIARGAVRSAKLTWWSKEPGTGNLGLLTIAGTLSTISNGFILILTAPAWVLTGTIASATYTFAPRTGLEPANPDAPDLRSLSRFPAGVPTGLDRSFQRVGAPARGDLRQDVHRPRGDERDRQQRDDRLEHHQQLHPDRQRHRVGR